MKISLDGGGIQQERGKAFGNAVYIENLLKALSLYETLNTYLIYTFSDKQHLIRKKNLIFQNLSPTWGWMKLRVPFEEIINPKEVYLALNQALPAYTSAKIITVTHGLSFYFHKDLFSKDFSRLESQRKEYLKRSDIILVSSTKIKKEIRAMKTDAIVHTLTFGIPFDFLTYKEVKRSPFFMFAGMNHPVKNVDFIVGRFLEFITHKEYSHFELYLCGPFEIYTKLSKQIKSFSDLPRNKLKNLYQTATGYLTASLYESFNFPVLEALSQKCPVVALESAVIPEMKEYVHSTTDQYSFGDSMKKVAMGEIKKNSLIKLRNSFSWKKYVQKLQELYKTLA